MIIPSSLGESCDGVPERTAWLVDLPRIVRELTQRWSLAVGAPFDGADVSCAWVAPAVRADGTHAVLKIGMPHFEGAHEIEGLRFWNGDPTVRLLDADDELNAMLLERCEPGTSLRELLEPEQDVVIATLLRRLWRTPPAAQPFRPLSALVDFWIAETSATPGAWIDDGVVREGFAVFKALFDGATETVVLATDLHAGNVLRANRQPWLVIDPKPFIGDPAYDATQHLLNCTARLHKDPRGTIRRFAHLLGVDAERVRLWLFARLAAGPGNREQSLALARTLA